MCTAFKMRVNCAYQVSPGMSHLQLWVRWRTYSSYFQPCVLQHHGYAYISDFEILLCHSSELKVFELAWNFLENLWTTAFRVYM